MSLKDKTISGFKWRTINQAVQAALSFITFTVLARLLGPEVFGLFALAFIVLDGLSMFKSVGVDSALIQRKEDVDKAANTAFLLTPMFGATVFLILFIAAPLASSFFNEPELKRIIPVLGFVFLLGSIMLTHNALLLRNMKFKVRSLIVIAGSITNSVVAIALAYFNYGVWSLVAGYFCKNVLMFVLTLLNVKFKPKFQFDRKIAGELVSFGKYVILNSYTQYLLVNFDKGYIGRVLGKTNLGYYTLSIALASLATKYIGNIIARVMFSAFSKVQDDIPLLRAQFLRVVSAGTLVSIPFSVGIFTLAPECINLIYGPEWAPAILVLQIVVVPTLIGAFFMCSGPLFMGVGRPKLMFWINLSQLPVIAIATFILAPSYGLVGVAVAFLISRMVRHAMTAYYIHKLIKVSFFKVFYLVRYTLLSAGVMSAFLYGVKGLASRWSVLTIDTHLELGFWVLTGAFIYLATYWLCDKETLLELRDVLAKRKNENMSKQETEVIADPIASQAQEFVVKQEVTTPCDLTVIICSYNRSKLLAQCLDRLMNQKVSEDVTWEVLVVNNNSTDDTEKIVNEYIERQVLPLRYVVEKKQGLSNARNCGIDHARGEVVAFTDDDVLLPNNWIQQLVEAFRENDYDGLGGKVEAKWEIEKPTWFSDHGKYALKGVILQYDKGDKAFIYDMKTKPPIGASMVFHRRVFEKYGKFNPELGYNGKKLVGGEDTDFCKRIISGGGKIAYRPDIVVEHPVEVERVTKQYFKRWYYGIGKAYILTAELPQNTKMILGVPAYELKELFTSTLKFIGAVVVFKREAQFYYKMRILRGFGMIAGAREKGGRPVHA